MVFPLILKRNNAPTPPTSLHQVRVLDEADARGVLLRLGDQLAGKLDRVCRLTS
jgi:hypothetical protein